MQLSAQGEHGSAGAGTESVEEKAEYLTLSVLANRQPYHTYTNQMCPDQKCVRWFQKVCFLDKRGCSVGGIKHAGDSEG